MGIHVPAAECWPWENRKLELSQNVLAVCGFDMLFDEKPQPTMPRYFKTLIFNQGFTIPNGIYFLADAGYSNCERLLMPYVGVRYHLKES